MLRFRIRTNWTNSVSEEHEFNLEDLAGPASRNKLKWAFSNAVRLRPGETRQSLTERAAASFATDSQALRDPRHAVRARPRPRQAGPVGRALPDRDKIMLLVEPVVTHPLLAEWEVDKAHVAGELERAEAARVNSLSSA
ncbi:MAG: hypothetical protein F4137_14170 [Acidobacteria bacterium]|nr:hypothetical protein [Acidobacteriota bacterium]MYH29964.1 hypothetical protein [Acidobacteriota bacterium]